MTWTSQCSARSAASGKRCCLLVGHPGQHATPGESFEAVMREGQIAFALRIRLELAATVRPLAGDGGPYAFPDGRGLGTTLTPRQKLRREKRYRLKKAGLRAGRVQAGRES